MRILYTVVYISIFLNDENKKKGEHYSFII